MQRRLLSSGEDAAAIRKARLQARKSANPKPAESGKSGGDAVANNESSTMSSAFMGFVASRCLPLPPVTRRVVDLTAEQ